MSPPRAVAQDAHLDLVDRLLQLVEAVEVAVHHPLEHLGEEARRVQPPQRRVAAQVVGEGLQGADVALMKAHEPVAADDAEQERRLRRLVLIAGEAAGRPSTNVSPTSRTKGSSAADARRVSSIERRRQPRPGRAPSSRESASIQSRSFSARRSRSTSSGDDVAVLAVVRVEKRADAFVGQRRRVAFGAASDPGLLGLEVCAHIPRFPVGRCRNAASSADLPGTPGVGP